MSWPIDEHTVSDVIAISEARRLSAHQRRMLARNIAGAVRPNRDASLWVLANFLSAIFWCHSRHAKSCDPNDFAIEMVMTSASERRGKLANYCDGQSGMMMTDRGI